MVEFMVTSCCVDGDYVLYIEQRGIHTLILSLYNLLDHVLYLITYFTFTKTEKFGD